MWCLETLKRLNAEAAAKPVKDVINAQALRALRKDFPDRFRTLVRIVNQTAKAR